MAGFTALQKTGRGRRRAARVLRLAAALLLLCMAAGSLLVEYAIGRNGRATSHFGHIPEASAEAMEVWQVNSGRQNAANLAFVERMAGSTQAAALCAGDGTSLAATWYPRQGSHLWAIVIHGYHGSGNDMITFVRGYYERGYQVLAPDLRGCGSSGGDYLGMGWLDRTDILGWVDWVLQQDPEAKIVLHGVSMGAATVMMAAGEDTPDAVRVFVEDCGYTSVWDMMAYDMRQRFGLPTFPLLDIANAMAALQAGYSYRQASALQQVARCQKPMLFIHGDADDFVPYEMMQPLYEAKPGDNKCMVTAAGAGHGQAVVVMGEGYWQTVFDFIQPYMG